MVLLDVPSFISPVSKLPLFLRLPVCRRSTLLKIEGWGRHVAESKDRKKAWPSINRSILSGCSYNLSLSAVGDLTKEPPVVAKTLARHVAIPEPAEIIK